MATALNRSGNVALRVLDRSLLRNPVLLSTLLGLGCSAAGIILPDGLQGAIDLLAPSAIPVALFCLGAGLEFRSLGSHRLELGWLILVKLVLHPAITWSALMLFGYQDPNWLLPTVMLCALPTGTLVHVIASRYRVEAKQTSLLIVLSTSISGLSLWLWSGLLLN